MNFIINPNQLKYICNFNFQRAAYLLHLPQHQPLPKKQQQDPLLSQKQQQPQQPLPQNQLQDPLMSQKPHQRQQPLPQNQLQDPLTLQKPPLKNLMYLQHLTMIMMT